MTAPGLAAARTPLIMAYHDSWRERAGVAADQTTLAELPGYVDVLALAFVKPDLGYRGGLDLSVTGFDYRIDGATLREAIAIRHRRHPGAKVLVSVGGAGYRNWAGLDAVAVGRLVRDLGADGVDVDYETADPGCARGPDGRIGCRVLPAVIQDIARLRRELPRPYMLSVGAVSVGAYGEGAFRDATPTGGVYVGAMLGLLRDPVARQIDLISLDAYDAGDSFDPMTAFRAYRVWWKGPLALGVEVRLQGGDGPYPSAATTAVLARQVAQDPQGGIMVYPALESPYGFAPSPTHPDGAGLLRAACLGMGRPDCR
jgi:chitinase